MSLADCAALITTLADANGVVRREDLRQAYAAKQPADNVLRVGGSRGALGSEDQILNRNGAEAWSGVKRYWQQNRYVGTKRGGKRAGESDGMRSTDRLSKNLYVLERLGAVRRNDDDTVTVADWSLIAAAINESLPPRAPSSAEGTQP